jgi:sulfur-oxidizing protein SoxA
MARRLKRVTGKNNGRWRRAAAAVLALHLAGTTLAQSTDPRRSGFETMSPRIQAMQRDDLQNPGMLWVADGRALWAAAPTPQQRSCASCHGDASQSMRGVAARYPALDALERKPVNLAQRINLCRTRNQSSAALAPEDPALLSLEAFVAHQSRGLPLAPPAHPLLDEARRRGRGLYEQRIGQLNLACASCHDQAAGRSLAGNTIPQGHVNGYPTYRLEWQSLGSLQRRLRGCMTGVRAQPFDFGSDELVALELFLAQRSAGLPVETPAVRP